MNIQRSRRSILSIAASLAMPILSGCLVGFPPQDGLEEGTIYIRNADSDPHTVVVTVSKISDDPDSDARLDRTPRPGTTPISQKTFTQEVAADETSEVLTLAEPGVYFIVAESEIRGRDSLMLDAPQAQGGISGGIILIQLEAHSHLNIAIAHDD